MTNTNSDSNFDNQSNGAVIQEWEETCKRLSAESAEKNVPYVPPPFPFDKMKQYLRAEIQHAVEGEVSKQVSDLRMSLCMSCPSRMVTYLGVTDPDGIGFCDACGCGANKRAALGTKTKMSGASCPKGLWGTDTGTGGNMKSVKDAAFGIISSATNFVKNMGKIDPMNPNGQNDLNKD